MSDPEFRLHTSLDMSQGIENNIIHHLLFWLLKFSDKGL